MQQLLSFGKTAACGLFLLTLGACERTADVAPTPNAAAVSGDYTSYGNDFFYALSGGVQLDKLSSGYNGGVLASVTISGLQVGETILGMDFRPANGQLYAVGSSNRIYTINPATGAATAVGTPFTPALNSQNVAFDFNPVVDRIRLVTDQDQNLRLNPNTGAVAAVDGSINPAAASITAVAYRNSVAGATSTVLYDIDPTTSKLYRQDPPNAGSLVEIGPLGLNFTGTEGGFDIAGTGDQGLGIFPIDGVSSLFTVDLRSGYARVQARYTKTYTAIALPIQAASSGGYSSGGY